MNDLVQGTPEWHQARLGKVTASRIGDMMATTKTGPSASRQNYLAELVCARLTGVPAESYQNAAMQWGNDQEAAARALYEFEREVDVEEVGFVAHPTIEMAGCSPDGLVGTEGELEIKCPNSATHLATLRGAPIDARYIKQMQFQLACTGRDWCDFASFDPRFPADLQLHVRRVMRDRGMIADIEYAVREFLDEVDRAMLDLRPDYGREVALDALRRSVAGE